jgi:two-component system, sensor histidine kinase LadS
MRAGRPLVWLAGLLALLLLIQATPSRAAPDAPPLVLTADTPSATLAGHLARHIDPDGRAGVDEIARTARFEPLPGFSTGGYSAAAQWYRVTIARRANARADWLLEFGQAYLDDVRVYLPQASGGFREVRMGRLVRYAERPLATRLHTLRLHLPDTHGETLYVRVASLSTLSFFGEVWSPDAFVGKETRANFLYGGYFGMLLLSIVMYAVLGSWLRDGSLLVYVGYLLTLFVSYLTLNGYAAVLFAPDDPRWLVALTGLGSMTGTLTAILVWDRFLDLGRHMPRVHRVMMVWACLLVPGLFSVVSPAYRTFAGFSNGSAALLSLMVLPGVMVWRIRLDVRQPLLYLYLLAFLAAMSSAGLQAGMSVGVVPLNWVTLNGYQVGSLVHVLVLNIALAWRVKQIQHDKLRAEQAALAAAQRAGEQRQLVALLSHEFRTPLAAISRAAQWLGIKLTHLVDKDRERIEQIRTRADHLFALVDKFLVSDALDYRAAALSREPVALQALLRQTLDTLDDSHASERIACRIEPADATCRVDRTLFGLALGNLVVNGLRYSPESRPVAVTATSDAHACVIDITDQGVGMDEAELAQLGTPYFRANPTTSAGTGLGFLLARKIIEAHGGTLSVRSAPGAGTTMTVRVPAA